MTDLDASRVESHNEDDLSIEFVFFIPADYDMESVFL